ncbi:cbb3-type cytochrome c oxidase N-terminal domain-containing protein [Hugenholtzia roseola]|uniref:cbb3-type cytochrome c oxidase N-terminal domain-containing protein n=1 Tax=Hugenholtzia roseola TaxID=1002 RepID=UPI0003FE202A|nr:cbb3-type cytochrome c oxidase N-terminal domain-containing protein [Hugenholtzia roseola]
MYKKIIFPTLALLLIGRTGFALSPTTSAGTFSLEELMILLLVLIVAIIVVLFIIIAFSFVQFIKLITRTEEEKAGIQAQKAQEDGFWKWFWDKFNAAAPIETEEQIILDHNYDGIRELDNQLPPWWKYGFYACIAASGWYLYNYHFTESEFVSVKEYREEMAIAAIQKEEYLKKMAALIDENNVGAYAKGDAGLEGGKKIYVDNCKSCHGAEGQGGVGPNLTDEYWLHGGSLSDIFKTVKYGVVEKGMISWKDQLSPKDIQDVSNYILTLQGTNPANAKEAQGELYKPEQK